MESMIEAIKNRISIRTYSDKLIGGETKKVILDILQSNTIGPFGNRMRFELLDFTELDKNEIKTLGTYGFIKGANLFIVGAIIPSNKAMEDYGYCLEKIILKVTNLGLGMCWLGGTFKRSGFAKRINVVEDEIVPCISPIGYANDKQAIGERLLKFLAKSHTRKPWSEIFFNGDFNTSLGNNETNQYSIALESVRLAPSGSNKQPWRIVKDKEKDTYHFYMKASAKETDTTDKEFKMSFIPYIDMGIAICHFELSAMELGLAGKWEHKDSSFAEIDNLHYIVSWVG
ncbi:MAG: nitroreductase family protein [Candidatus Poribacteria bacterium]